jgi:NADH dehydrogenase/NADH:ubiquinone oxidoreductase subunit G
MIKILVDNKEVEAEEGSSVLQACLDNGIYIPNLCYVKGMDKPPASCRLCFVEIDGEDRPTTSCTTRVREGMRIKTDTLAVRSLQRSAFELLLSVHDVDCARCPANKKCGLQDIAKFLKVGLKPKRLEQYLKKTGVEEAHPVLNYHPNRCVLCGRCIYVCEAKHGRPFLAFAKRGFDTTISFYGARDIPGIPCGECVSCVGVCPVGALTVAESLDTGLQP